MSQNKKGVENLSEDENVRLVKLHFHRFSKFLRYLDANNATITIAKEGRESTESITYVSNDKKDVPKVRALVQNVLGVSHYQVADYYRSKLGLDDKHSNRDRIREKLGDVLYGIKVQIKDDREDNLRFQPFSDLSFERKYRVNCMKRFKIDLSDFSHNKEDSTAYNDRDSLSTYFASIRNKKTNAKKEKDELLFQVVNHHVKVFIKSNFLTSLSQDVNYLNKEAVEFEKHLLGNKNSEYVVSLKEETLKLTRLYNRILYSYNGSEQILPYYDDLSILGDFEMAARSICRNGGRDIQSFNESISDLDRHDLIYFRYEILELLLYEADNPKQWDIRLQALFVLCYCELLALSRWFKMLRKEIIGKIRFTILSKFSSSETSVQIDNLTFNNLRHILFKYHIPDNSEKIFQFNTDNLLLEPLHKYPDYHAIRSLKEDDILHIRAIIYNRIIEKIKQDLHLSSNILLTSDLTAN